MNDPIKTFDCAGCSGHCYGGYHMAEDKDGYGDWVRKENHDAAQKILLERIEALQVSLDRLHGAKFSDRDYAALVDRAERNEIDAARYRCLREQHWNESDIAVVRYPKESVKLGSDCPSSQRLDDLIDAALSATKEQG